MTQFGKCSSTAVYFSASLAVVALAASAANSQQAAVTSAPASPVDCSEKGTCVARRTIGELAQKKYLVAYSMGGVLYSDPRTDNRGFLSEIYGYAGDCTTKVQARYVHLAPVPRDQVAEMVEQTASRFQGCMDAHVASNHSMVHAGVQAELLDNSTGGARDHLVLPIDDTPK